MLTKAATKYVKCRKEYKHLTKEGKLVIKQRKEKHIVLRKLRCNHNDPPRAVRVHYTVPQ
jgi:hypothetical protein